MSPPGAGILARASVRHDPRPDKIVAMPGIHRRQFLSQSVAGAALAQQNQPLTGRPNILHIMSDQQQWGCVADRSPARTPNLNRLVKEGTLFERSYTPSAVCCPARAMILSGAYHWHNGVFNQIHSSWS